MIPAIDPLELRRQIQALPDAAKAAAGALFTECQWPKLDSGEWTRDRLWNAAVLIHEAVEAEGFAAWVYPIDTAPLVERSAALPDDLADFAAENVREAEVPNVARPRLWTLEHWTIADAALEHAEALAAKRLRHVHAALGAAAVGYTGDITSDEGRHEIVSIVTGGRTESSRKLTGPEARHLADWAEAIASGVSVELEPLTVDWKAEAKRLGTTQADLLKEAKTWAKFHHLEAPKALGDITSHRLIAALLTTADDGETIMETTAPEVASLPEPDVGISAADKARPDITQEEPEEEASPLAETLEHWTTTDELAALKERLATVEATLAHVAALEERLAAVEATLAAILEHVAALEERLAAVEATLAAILEHVRSLAEIAVPGVDT
jgi:uncharacterized coiled-coil protein SlyX